MPAIFVILEHFIEFINIICFLLNFIINLKYILHPAPSTPRLLNLLLFKVLQKVWVGNPTLKFVLQFLRFYNWVIVDSVLNFKADHWNGRYEFLGKIIVKTINHSIKLVDYVFFNEFSSSWIDLGMVQLNALV